MTDFTPILCGLCENETYFEVKESGALTGDCTVNPDGRSWRVECILGHVVVTSHEYLGMVYEAQVRAEQQGRDPDVEAATWWADDSSGSDEHAPDPDPERLRELLGDRVRTLVNLPT